MINFGPYDAEAMAADLSVFADVGTDAPSIEPINGGIVIRFIRRGDASELRADNYEGALIEVFQDKTIKHANLKALLASERYGSLREWANKQNAYFQHELAGQKFIEQGGFLDNNFEMKGLEEVDDVLASPFKENSARVLLIDGPAGIGKTQFIQRLAYKRASSYNSLRRPLLLHVQSRGRTLSYIYDLMAFSLQRLRIDTTFDQVPILAKHGLITVAIDGFSIADSVKDLSLRSVNIDEVRFSGTAAAATLEKVVISQFDCRGADISNVKFEGTAIYSLIADEETLLPSGFPYPNRIQDISEGGRSLSEPAQIKSWVDKHLRNPPEREKGLIPANLRDHPAVLLLERACRLRHYWLRRGDDLYASRILDSQWWPLIESTLLENNLLRLEIRPASGSDARFIHIRRSPEILSENASDQDVASFFASFVRKISSSSEH